MQLLEAIAEVMLALIRDEATRHDYQEVPEDQSESDGDSSGKEGEQQDPTQASAKEEQLDEQATAELPAAAKKKQATKTSASATARGHRSKTRASEHQCKTTSPATTPTVQSLNWRSKPAHGQCEATPPAIVLTAQHFPTHDQTPTATTSTLQGLPSTGKAADEQTPVATTPTTQGLPLTSQPADSQTPPVIVSTAQDLPADSQPPAATTPVGQRRPTPAATAAYKSQSSKNKRRQCALCPFFGTHLERHVMAKHPDAAQSKSERATLIHRHDKLSRKKQGKKEVCLYQCGIASCGAIVTRLGQHLKRVHQISDKEKLKKVKSFCLRLPPKSARQPKH